MMTFAPVGIHNKSGALFAVTNPIFLAEAV